jgi:uncharacterized protein YegP (UPF0339 family)
MAKKKASKKSTAPAALPAYSFRTYGDSAGGFLFALVRGKDGATLLYSNAAAPYKTLKACKAAIDEVKRELLASDVPVLSATD